MPTLMPEVGLLQISKRQRRRMKPQRKPNVAGRDYETPPQPGAEVLFQRLNPSGHLRIGRGGQLDRLSPEVVGRTPGPQPASGCFRASNPFADNQLRGTVC